MASPTFVVGPLDYVDVCLWFHSVPFEIYPNIELKCLCRGYPSLMSYIGAQLVEMGEPLAALLSASYNGAELLSCAVLSGSCPVMNITAAWATKSGVVVNWRAQGTTCHYQ